MIKILSPLLSGLEYDDYEMGNMTDVEMMEAEVNINIDNDDDDDDDFDQYPPTIGCPTPTQFSCHTL